MPSCSRVRRQLLHFHVVCKRGSYFNNYDRSFRLGQLNFSENRNKQRNQKNTRIIVEICFYCLPTSPSLNVFLKFPSNTRAECKSNFFIGSLTSAVVIKVFNHKRMFVNMDLNLIVVD